MTEPDSEYIIVGTSSNTITNLQSKIARMHDSQEKLENRITEQNNRIENLIIENANQKRRIAENRIYTQEMNEQIRMLQEDCKRPREGGRVWANAVNSTNPKVLYANPNRWQGANRT